MIESYETVWNGAKDGPNAGLLACKPETLVPVLAVGPECARRRARKGEARAPKRSTATYSHAGVVARLESALTQSTPMTVKELVERIGWRPTTVRDAIHWCRQSHPGRLCQQLSDRVPHTSRRPNEYWIQP